MIMGTLRAIAANWLASSASHPSSIRSNAEFHAALEQCRTMRLLCEHETQGIAYQQALSCNVPILAWERSGYWQDPAYYPDKVKFAPVTSVPYWDDRCGRTFKNAGEFPSH